MTRAEVIAALERAEGPSRELDRECALACGWASVSQYGFGRDMLREPGTEALHIDAPRYTASIDAALTLMPEGASWFIEAYPREPQFEVSVYTVARGYRGESKSLAIALCIAALKARGETT